MVQIVLILIACLSVFVFPSSFSEGKKRACVIALVMFLCFLIGGLRHEAVGADTISYRFWFERVELQSWGEIFSGLFTSWGAEDRVRDPLYALYTKTFQIFSTNYRAFMFFVLGCFYLPFARWLYKYVLSFDGLILAFVFFLTMFFPFVMTGYRQTLALAVCLVAYDFIVKRKLGWFLLFMAVAVLFHKSAAVFLPFYFLSRIKQTSLVLWVALLAFPIVFYFRTQFAVFLAGIAADENYMNYALGEGELGAPVNFTLLFLVVALFSAIMSSPTCRSLPDSRPYFVAVALALLFLPLPWLNPVLMRVVMYYAVFLHLCLPAIGQSWERRASGMGRTMVLVSVVTVIAFTFLRGGAFFFMWEHVPGHY
ncbi:MAG: EpsG family protein [Verrucomicrobia bacterium]|nr:EpsG family protein [Verrucomicrobiota bacterium]